MTKEKFIENLMKSTDKERQQITIYTSVKGENYSNKVLEEVVKSEKIKYKTKNNN